MLLNNLKYNIFMQHEIEEGGRWKQTEFHKTFQNFPYHNFV